MSDYVRYPGRDIRVISLGEGLISRPTMYLGKKSASLLGAFITGCMCAETAQGLPAGSTLEMNLEEFEIWVHNKTRKPGALRSWEVAKHMCDGDEARAFDLWVEWYKEFTGIDPEKNEREWNEAARKYREENNINPALY